MEINLEIYIQKIRKQKRLTLEQLARLSGISKTEINDIELGKKFPSIKTLCCIAKALQIPIHELFKC